MSSKVLKQKQQQEVEEPNRLSQYQTYEDNSRDFSTLSPDLLAMLGEQESRIDRMYLQIGKPKIRNHSYRKNDIINTIDSGLKSARLALPKLPHNPSSSSPPPQKSPQSRLFGIYGLRHHHRRPTPTASYPISPLPTLSPTPHLLPKSPSQLAPSVSVPAMHRYYLELQELMTKPVEIEEMAREERRVRELRKSYRHMQSFDKGYFMGVCRLEKAVGKGGAAKS